METDLTIRLQAYADSAGSRLPNHAASSFAEALASSAAASTAASASLISSHTRVLRGGSPPQFLLPGQDEIEVLVAEKPAQPPQILPLPAGRESIANLARGAAGIPSIKNRHE